MARRATRKAKPRPGRKTRPPQRHQKIAESTPALDPRLTPARPDLAAKHLEGKVQAARFVEGVVREVIAAQAPVRREPSPDAALGTEALKGELVTVFESTGEGWAWGQLMADKYVGFLPAAALGPRGSLPTHRVAVPRTLVFPGPSIKLPPIDALSFGCLLAIARTEEPFAVTTANGFVALRHLMNVETTETDFVAVAERFLGVPYLWGGKTSFGLDCSGLVQLALTAIGRPCPRDSDVQEETLGLPITPASDFSNLKRGDLMFWNGHVAIMRDATTLIHANAFHMAVTIESIRKAAARIRAAGSDVTSVRRIEGVFQ